MSTSILSSRRGWTAAASAALVSIFLISGCETKTETITITITDTLVVEAPRYSELPEGHGDFVGYRASDDAGATACGQCHSTTQGGWLTTEHAEAWATLQGSGGAQAFCEGCHTLNARGNQSEVDAGWTATADARYYDVQCESCHGPGKDHIDVPDANAGPLAQAAVSLDPLVGCGQCHNGTHNPFVEEWSESPHANIVGFAAARADCASCHRGQGTLIAWGENADYVEKDGEALAVTCVVCHDPHGSDNDANTRFSARAPNTDANLCAKCHNRTTEPNAESTHGLAPHAPQAPLVIGTAGWFPPGMGFDPDIGLAGTHGTARNEDFCATCHVQMYEVTAEDGGFIQRVTGHLFLSVPCLDEQGLPTNEDCGINETERNFTGCTAAGCHGTPKVASDLLFVASGRLANGAGEVLDLLWLVDPNLDGPGGEIDPGDGLFTTAEGAFFNVNLAQFPGREGSEQPGDNPTRADVTSASTHNALLMEALLLGSKQAVENEYGVGAGAEADYSPRIQRIMEKVARNRGPVAQQ